ncbi:BatD family protein [Methylomonas sp. HYX-M1]|uniref:BatD family protein n=1 Tax=Methylomonas sp. HYX-M1 TaxID=3139307 RepID=UPI00345BF544
MKKWRFFWLAGAFVLIGNGVFAAEIRVNVDRNPVSLNESFRIVFKAVAQVDGSPDFSPLERDFDILNQQRSSNMSWINGKSSREEQWILDVMAKRAGDLTIPPIAFGADLSQTVSVSVTDSPQAQAADNAGEDLFLQVQATPQAPYVQSQVLVSVKFFRRVQVAQASLTEPDLNDALVEKLGDDSTYSTPINGVDYTVTERQYAIFPQQSGKLTIPALVLNAEVLGGRQPRFNGFFNRAPTETRRVSSDAIVLDVQPVPQTYQGSAWLTADSLTLSQVWSDQSLSVNVGEPLTRTITLSAHGTTVGQLPELVESNGIDGIKTYPDQPLLKEDKLSGGLTAVRQEKIAYIPGKPGSYTLPPLQLVWFNTRTQKAETASLPAVTIQAVAADGGQTRPAEVLAQDASTRPDSPIAAANTAAIPNDAGYWPWLSGFLGLGWLLTLVWIVVKSRQAKAVVESARPVAPLFDFSKPLRDACRRHDPQAAKNVLLAWGAQQYGVDNLAALAGCCAQPLQLEIKQLNRCLYAGDSGDWDAHALERAFAQHGKQPDRAPPPQTLEPLYRL